MPFGMGFGELVLILVIVVVVFGATKLPQLGDGLGKAIKNFKRAVNSQNEIDVSPGAKGRSTRDDASSATSRRTPSEVDRLRRASNRAVDGVDASMRAESVSARRSRRLWSRALCAIVSRRSRAVSAAYLTSHFTKWSLLRWFVITRLTCFLSMTP